MEAASFRAATDAHTRADHAGPGPSRRKLAAILGVETGGTKILCRLMSDSGDVLLDRRFPTGSPEKAVEDIAGCVSGLAEGHLAAIGLASFGPVWLDEAAPDYGHIIETPKPGWSGFDLRAALAARLNAPVTLDTDVNGAALAEQRFGAGAGLGSVAYVTVGTGIGAGLAISGRTLRGAMHPEIGHLRLRRRSDDPMPSICPYHDDCAEGLAAGPAIRRRLGEGGRIEWRPDVIQLVADYLGQVCAALLLAWSPHRIVIGGGVLDTPGLREAILPPLRRAVGDYGPAALLDRPDFLCAPALRNPGLAGALFLAAELAGFQILSDWSGFDA
jgi:fructokinase